jgi:hypothetical protein
MSVKHAYQSATSNDAGKEVSSTRWNEAHVIDMLDLPAQASDPSAPASGLLLYVKNSGMFAAKIAGMANHSAVLQTAIWDRRVTLWMANNANGLFVSSNGTTYGNTHFNVGQALTNRYAYSPRSAWNNVATTANQNLGLLCVNGATLRISVDFFLRYAPGLRLGPTAAGCGWALAAA